MKRNFFFPFVLKKFYLPFLAHGLERFFLFVAVGEAGRPNDDYFLLLIMERFFLIYILTLGCRCMPWRGGDVGSGCEHPSVDAGDVLVCQVQVRGEVTLGFF